MKKEIIIACICVGLMLVTPLSGVAQEHRISNNIKEQSNDVNGLVVQIRTFIEEILEKYEYMPIISNLCKDILNTLRLVGYLLFCMFLLILLIPLGILFQIFLNMGIYLVYWFFAGLLFVVIDIFDSECLQFLPNPINYIYTIPEINDILELDCPCPKK